MLYEVITEPLKKVTVEGQVLTELDLTNAVLESVPTGTKIIFRIDSRDLVAAPVAGYTYQVLQYEATVDADGYFSVELPSVNFNAVPVEVVLNPFVAEQTIAADNKKDMVYESSSNYVITSYSIHYTKLYDRNTCTCFYGIYRTGLKTPYNFLKLV